MAFLHRIASASLLFLVLGVAYPHDAGPLRIVIARHAEKPDEGDNLSCKGLNRALALPAVIIAKFGRPDHSYVPTPGLGKSTKHGRMLQTIVPLAVKLNLKVDTRFQEDDVDDLAQDVLGRSGTVLMIW